MRTVIVRSSNDTFAEVSLESVQIRNNANIDSKPFHCQSDACEAKDLLCCRRYRVLVTREESERITKILPEIGMLPNIDDGLPGNSPFILNDDNTIEITHTSKHHACVFLCYDESGVPLCGVHRAADILGLDYRDFKPLSCRLFPLELVEGPASSVEVTLHPDWQTFPCLSDSARLSTEPLSETRERELTLSPIRETRHEV